jgi:hypothetical protein
VPSIQQLSDFCCHLKIVPFKWAIHCNIKCWMFIFVILCTNCTLKHKTFKKNLLGWTQNLFQAVKITDREVVFKTCRMQISDYIHADALKPKAASSSESSLTVHQLAQQHTAATRFFLNATVRNSDLTQPSCVKWITTLFCKKCVWYVVVVDGSQN